jgi:hypothetical protein
MRRNDKLAAVTDQLEAAGVDYEIKRGRHIKVRFSVGGVARTCLVAATGSDWRGALNNRARVRRMLRQDMATGATS